MFERYTERARRVLFFARYEASQLGGLSVDTDHLLLALIREGKGLTNRLFAESQVSTEALRQEIEGRAGFREKVPTSIEIPCSPDAKRVFQLAADEADRLGHSYIGTEHLLLGLLREGHSPTASLLEQKGLRADPVRDALVALPKEGDKTVDGWKSRPCCFCGEGFPIAAAALLVVISPVESRSYSQYLYAHPHCLRARVHPDVSLTSDTGQE